MVLKRKKSRTRYKKENNKKNHLTQEKSELSKKKKNIISPNSLSPQTKKNRESRL